MTERGGLASAQLIEQNRRAEADVEPQRALASYRPVAAPATSAPPRTCSPGPHKIARASSQVSDAGAYLRGQQVLLEGMQ